MKFLREYCHLLIRHDETIYNAMELIEENHMRSLVVCDSEYRLMGTLSDGDIRRHMIRANTARGCVSDIYNTSCISLIDTVANIESEAKKLFTSYPSVSLIPVCSEDGFLVLIVTRV